MYKGWSLYWSNGHEKMLWPSLKNLHTCTWLCEWWYKCSYSVKSLLHVPVTITVFSGLHDLVTGCIPLWLHVYPDPGHSRYYSTYSGDHPLTRFKRLFISLVPSKISMHWPVFVIVEEGPGDINGGWVSRVLEHSAVFIHQLMQCIQCWTLSSTPGNYKWEREGGEGCVHVWTTSMCGHAVHTAHRPRQHMGVGLLGSSYHPGRRDSLLLLVVLFLYGEEVPTRRMWGEVVVSQSEHIGSGSWHTHTRTSLGRVQIGGGWTCWLLVSETATRFSH